MIHWQLITDNNSLKTFSGWIDGPLSASFELQKFLGPLRSLNFQEILHLNFMIQSRGLGLVRSSDNQHWPPSVSIQICAEIQTVSNSTDSVAKNKPISIT